MTDARRIVGRIVSVGDLTCRLSVFDKRGYTCFGISLYRDMDIVVTSNDRVHRVIISVSRLR